MARLEEVYSKRTLSVIVNPDGTIREPSIDAESRSIGFNLDAKNLREFLDSPVLDNKQKAELTQIYALNGHEQLEYHVDIGKEPELRHLHFIFKPTNQGTYLSVVDDTKRTLARRQTEALAKERDLVARLMRHDVKPPLVQAGGFADVSLRKIEAFRDSLKRGENPDVNALIDTLYRNLEIVDASVQDMEGIMLNLTQLGAVSKVPLDMHNDVVFHALNSARRYVRDTHKVIAFDEANIMKSGRALLKADKVRCQVVYRNLLNNAIKYMQGVSRVCCGVEDCGTYFKFNVYNQGPIIPENIIERIFQEGVTGDEHAGSGLGLFVARTYIKEQGGRIWAEKNRREGANIIFTLPKE
jgi:signal transduction histidine kinase